MFIQVDCIMCGDTTLIEVPEEGYKRWKSGELIQNALPELYADERELLISGICGKCYDKIFGGE